MRRQPAEAEEFVLAIHQLPLHHLAHLQVRGPPQGRRDFDLHVAVLLIHDPELPVRVVAEAADVGGPLVIPNLVVFSLTLTLRG